MKILLSVVRDYSAIWGQICQGTSIPSFPKFKKEGKKGKKGRKEEIKSKKEGGREREEGKTEKKELIYWLFLYQNDLVHVSPEVATSLSGFIFSSEIHLTLGSSKAETMSLFIHLASIPGRPIVCQALDWGLRTQRSIRPLLALREAIVQLE